jgi:hypothetical protein
VDAILRDRIIGWISVVALLCGTVLTAVIALMPEFAPCRLYWYSEPLFIQLILCQLYTTTPGIIAVVLLGLSACATLGWAYLTSKRGVQSHGT